jgi:hypothetical protein
MKEKIFTGLVALVLSSCATFDRTIEKPRNIYYQQELRCQDYNRDIACENRFDYQLTFTLKE